MLATPTTAGLPAMTAGRRDDARTHVVIAGGGVAGLEALLALRDLAGDRVRITLISPEREFQSEQLRAASLFSVGHVRRLSVVELCRASGARFVEDRLEAV